MRMTGRRHSSARFRCAVKRFRSLVMPTANGCGPAFSFARPAGVFAGKVLPPTKIQANNSLKKIR